MIAGTQPKVLLDQDDLYPKEYTLVRERDGLTKKGTKILWIEWNEDGTFNSSYKEPQVERSLIIDPQSLVYGWLTTTVTEIVEQREDYIKFKTENSNYELFINSKS
jgi:hypothetical protein